LGKVVTEGLAPLLLLENQMKKPKRQCQIGKPLKHIIKQVRSFTSFQMVHTHTHLHLAELTQNRGNHFAAVFTPVQTWKLQHFHVKILRKNDVKEQFFLKKNTSFVKFSYFFQGPPMYFKPRFRVGRLHPQSVCGAVRAPGKRFRGLGAS
jgi:hypothetical protein